jgi:hypothetical protein
MSLLTTPSFSGCGRPAPDEASRRRSIRRRFDQAKITAPATVEDIHARAPRIEENEKLLVQDHLIKNRRFHRQPRGSSALEESVLVTTQKKLKYFFTNQP